VVLRDGQPIGIEPLADGGTVEFGEPIGAGATIYTLHSELRTFGTSFGCSEVSFRLSLAPALLERLRELASASDRELVGAAREAAPPSAETVSVHVVDAAAGGDAVRVRVLTEPHREWGLGGGIVSTAAPAAATMRLLARGSLTTRGAHPPESCIDPEEMFAELESRGATLEVEASEVARA
jgi:saccharopine dehydrogenase-like NADP-dependent oxidoreductase